MLPEMFQRTFWNCYKVKLVTKIKKLYQLYFQTLVLASYCYFGDNA